MYKGYPYDQGDGREDLEAEKKMRRVLRGGAFGYRARRVRCAYRDENSPRYCGRLGGFRMMVASPVRL